MLKPSYAKQFQRDLDRMLKRGKEGEKIKKVILKLVDGLGLEPRFRDHKLLGKFKDRRECHIEPDWLLIYRKTEEEIVFERTGSHADLFD